jgi:hypothetical protein
VGEFSEPTINDSKIVSNDSGWDGGGLAASGVGTNVRIVNSWIQSNEVLSDNYGGGGLAFLGDAGSATQIVAKVMNTVITGNRAPRGGAVFIYGSTEARLSNSTFYNNVATGAEKGHAVRYVFPGIDIQAPSIIGNSIIWNAATPEGYQVNADPGPDGASRVAIQYSDVLGTVSGYVEQVANLNPPANPLFMDTISYRLQALSPCIDRGDQVLRLEDFADLDGDGYLSEPTPRDLDLFERVVGPNIDLGAYEMCFGTCDDGIFCTGQEACVDNGCVRTFITGDCNYNDWEDVCDIQGPPQEGGVLSDDCNADGVPDECTTGSDAIALIGASYVVDACDATLPRFQGNVVRLTFKCPPTWYPITAAPVRFRVLAENGGFGG